MTVPVRLFVFGFAAMLLGWVTGRAAALYETPAWAQALTLAVMALFIAAAARLRRPRPPAGHRCQGPLGRRFGTLWRCDCGTLYRVGDACDMCDLAGRPIPHQGQCRVGGVWRPVGLLGRVAARMRRQVTP